MSEKKESKLRGLIKKYPHLFPKHRETGEPFFYFECGDGWYDLIECLFAQINGHSQNWEYYPKTRQEKYLDVGKEVPKYITEYLEKHPEKLKDFHVEQVKEKFGGLRFYTTYVNDEIQGGIDFAEEMSFRICEDCGNPGKVYGGSWIVTRCEAHKPKAKAKTDEM
jgi:hypothetical protein